ncbi:hypothetical protein K503DRAFT_777989 [Rhizopogon vinicolor AM-OR11-026]|uniref:Uncharacterized protein n=1 Tax=Rhizopogon vinicolor AM-OR11-026 TaxID=1314800 RepID=A0A1B7ME52_9AGAM|nr:hypothetical protein K503DRAFT_777989 [Rhizopogon vinicolor AM-OR11-026]
MSRGELRGWVGNLAASSSEGLGTTPSGPQKDEYNYVAVGQNPGNTTSITEES